MLPSISVGECKTRREEEEEEVFSVLLLSSHKLLFVLLESFERVVCHSVVNCENRLHFRRASSLKTALAASKKLQSSERDQHNVPNNRGLY